MAQHTAAGGADIYTMTAGALAIVSLAALVAIAVEKMANRAYKKELEEELEALNSAIERFSKNIEECGREVERAKDAA
jgi:diacylglycerol kinase